MSRVILIAAIISGAVLTFARYSPSAPSTHPARLPATRPADPASDLAAGTALCFDTGDWTSGLPLLLHGTDPALRAMAERDLAVGDSPIMQAVLGHDWW